MPELLQSTDKTEPTSQVQHLQERLMPHETTDDAGFTRQVFTFGNQELVFKGREELPVIEGFENAVLAGNQEIPKFNNHTIESGTDYTKIIANQTPLGVAEAGLLLGIQSEYLKQIAEDLRGGIYSALALEFVDSIMACRLVNGEGEVSKLADPSAEAIVLLALSGDVEAISEVNMRRNVIDVHDSQKVQDDHLSQKVEEAEPLDPNLTLLVRKTDVTPMISSSGGILLKSTADETQGRFARHSIHFALDTTVVSNNAGNWDGKKYTVVDTLGAVLQKRGRTPTGLLSNDTWFEQNPCELLDLPSGIVFAADPTYTGEPIQEGAFITYNPELTSLDELLAKERVSRGILDTSEVSAHGWEYGKKSLQLSALSKKLGINRAGHAYSNEIKLEQRLAGEVAMGDGGLDPNVLAKQLFEGNLRVDWKKLNSEYVFIDENGNPTERKDIDLLDTKVPSWVGYGEPNTGGTFTTNELLANSSAEMRRCYYAYGYAIPRTTTVRGVRKPVYSGLG